MQNQDKIKLWNIVGKLGKYQFLAQVFQFYTSAFTGTTQLTVQILAPMVTMHWKWETNSPNRTEFKSIDCVSENLLSYNFSSNFSTYSSELIYESEYSRNTLTEKFDLVCERSWLVSFSNTLYILGIGIGFLTGELSERYGRKSLIVLLLVLLSLSCIGILFSQNYIMFAVFMFIMGVGSTQPSTLFFMLVFELLPPTTARYQTVIGKSGFLFGQLLMVGVAWLIKDWFFIQVFQVVLVAGAVAFVWYFKESPAWLAVRGRYREAEESLLDIAEKNGRDVELVKPLIAKWLAEMKERCEVQTKAEKGKYMDIFKNKTIAFHTLSTCFLITAIRYVVFGLLVNTESFGTGMYLDLSLASAVSIAAVIVVAVLLLKVSIKKILLVYYAAEVVICALYPALQSYPAARTVLLVLSRVVISSLACISFAYFAELFPTSVRGVGIGFSNLAAMILATGSPFTKELGEKTAIYVPFILYMVMCIISAVLVLLLPDTSKRDMAHTVGELTSNGDKAETANTTSSRL